MPTSLYMPSIEVHIAFDSGYTTPAASRTWVDVSDYVELHERIGIDVGRLDERSSAGANTLSLTLDNSDGRFTAGLQHLVNRVQDPSMRGWGTWYPLGAPGWAIGNNGNAPGETNGRALGLTASGTYRQVQEPQFPVTPGDQYRVRAYGWVQSTATGGGGDSVLATLWFFDSGGAFIGTLGSATAWTVADAGAGWIQREQTGTVPVGAVTAAMTVRATAGLTSGAWLIDAVEAQQVNPYYPNVKLGRPIRVRVTPPGGTTSTRFVGFVDEWPVEWEDTDAYAKARIRATSRLARLGLSTRLRSMLEEQILAAQPAGYWTLGDPVDSTSAAESSGTGAAPLLVTEQPGSPGAIVFGSGTGPGTDGLTAATFADGQFLETPFPGGAPRAFHVSFRTQIADGSLMRIGNLNLFIQAGGQLRAVPGTGGGSTLTGPTVNDGLTHDATFFLTGSTWALYVDGVSYGTTATGTISDSPLRVGIGFTGTISHVAYYNDASGVVDGTVAVLIAEAAAGTAERTDERLIRALGWAGVPSSEATAETGAETMTYQKTAGQSVVDALRVVESTEGGVLFDGRDGNVTFHNRSHRYLASPAATLDMAAQEVEAGYAPKLDRSALVNDATAENPTTGESARYVDAVSRDEYGVAANSVDVAASTYDPLVQRAAWEVASYAEPRNRVPSLTVNVLAQQVDGSPSAQTLLGVNVGDLLAVTNAPAQNDTTDPSYFVEGYTETMGPESYEISFNLSPTYLTLSTFVIGDPVRGQLDGGFVLGL